MKGGDKPTSAIIDNLLRFLVEGGALSVAIFAPDATRVFDKQLRDYLRKLDNRSRKREYKRVLYYMKQQGLVARTSDDYEHGIRITQKGKDRLQRTVDGEVEIPRTAEWDGRWRIVFFDIPENHRAGRRALTYRLRRLGFQQLQKSVWIYPFPCRPEIESVAEDCDIQKYITYIEATGIDAEHLLKQRFKSLFKNK